MVETAYTSQDFAKRSSWMGSSSKDLYGATWKNPSYSNIGAQPVQPVVLQPSVLGQTSNTLAPSTTSSLLPSATISGGFGTGLTGGGITGTGLTGTGFTGTGVTGAGLAGTGLTGTGLTQPLVTQTLNAPPLNQVEHVYEKQVINQPYVHQVVHHPINEIHQQHMRNDVYTQPVTQVIPEQRFMGPTTGMYSSGVGFTPGATATGPAYQKQGFLDRLKAKRAQRKLAKQQMYGGGVGAPMSYGTTTTTAAPTGPIIGPSTGSYGVQPLYQQQQFPAQSAYQSGIAPLQSSYLPGQYGTQQTLGTGSWVSGQPRI